eukprot:6891643-Pyramimonas_sp.AAC.1
MAGDRGRAVCDHDGVRRAWRPREPSGAPPQAKDVRAGAVCFALPVPDGHGGGVSARQLRDTPRHQARQHRAQLGGVVQ